MHIILLSSTLFKRIVKIFFIIFFLFSINAQAEGTKQITPNSTNKTVIEINNATTNVPFATWNCAPEYRLNIKICNHLTEKIYMGFQTSGSNLNNVYWRLKDPNGNIVVGPTLIPTSAAAGYCATYAEAVAGPSQLGITGGYNAFVYTPPTLDGDYVIEFNVGTTISTGLINLKFLDITVATGGNAAGIKLGRLWSKDWELQTLSGTEPYLGVMYVYSTDGIVTKLDFNGMKPAGFHVACNSKGTNNTGNYADDRVSKISNETYPEYKIFLNNPDISCYPSGSWGNLNAVTITGCAPNYCINVNIDRTGPIGVIIDLNGQAGYQPNSSDISISKDDAVAGANCIPWDGKDGTGALVTSGTNITVQVDFFNGVTNLPLYDVEDNPNGFLVKIVRPTPPIAADTIPAIYWDDSQVIAGTAIDGKTNLTGCKLATGCHKWSGRGNNGCSPTCPETINTWWYANRQTKSVPFSTFYVDVDANASTVGKGASNASTKCGVIAPINLNASKTGATGVTWSTNGTGTFSPNVNALNATYTPSAADLTSGSVKLSIVTTGNTNGVSTCPATNDFFDITLQKPPTVNAGSDVSYCANKPNISLNGTFANGVTAIAWSGGSGTYAPNATTKNATYTPTATEIKSGKVTLTIKSTAGNGVCPVASDFAVFSIDSVQRVRAGANGSVCANNATINLTGTLGNGATSPIWSGGTGTFANANSAITSYTPSNADKTAGTVTLRLTASKATCNNVSSPVTYTITPAPTVFAGTDLNSCANNPKVTLNGSFTVATGIQWIGGTGTFTPNRTTKNATYTPSTAEITAKTVTLTLETTGNGLCTKVSDQVTINIAPSPIANAGSDGSVCINNPNYTLAGTITNATGGIWTGNGASFVPNNTTLNAKYVASATEISAGITYLLLTTTGNGTCLSTLDTMFIVMDPVPVVDAGKDTSICKNKLTLQLNGFTQNNTSQTWTTSGTGTFSNINLTNAIYTPSTSDTLGTVTLTLKANRTGCNQVSDAILISFNKAPSVNAGSNVSVCKNNPVANLNGFSSTGSGTWTGGTGILTDSSYIATTAEAITGTPITLTFKTTNNKTCNAVQDQMQISFYNAPTVNAGLDQNICSNNIDINLTGTSSTNAGNWNGGNGVFSPDTNSITVTYIPTAAEINSGSVTLSFSSRNNNGCLAVSDNIKINFTPSPIVDAGIDKRSCANNVSVAISGIITNAGGGIWSNGGGSFSSTTNTLVNNYTSSSSEIQNGEAILILTSTNNGNCNPVADSLTISIVPAPIVDAGADQVVCGDVTSVTLAGAISNVSGAIWSKTGFASGSFSDANSLTSNYIPSAIDIDSGYVDLQLASTGNGTCIAVNDIVRLYFTSVPSINAGPDQTVCSNDFPVLLNGIGSPGVWTGGLGTYSPSANDLNATYIPTANEINNGFVDLTYITNATTTCSSKSDIVKITLNPAPTVNAGTTISTCSNATSINLNGTVSNGTAQWSTTGSGTFSPNTNTLNATYKPSNSDANDGFVKLVLTSTGNGFCSPITDTLLINLTPAPIVNAGSDQNFCVSNNTNADLNGIIQNSSLGGTWSGGNGTYTPDNTSLTANYIPTAAEIAAGNLTLTLSSISDGVCPVITNQVQFTFKVSPTANAGIDKTVCETSIPVNLTATTTSATTGNWTSLGAGNFTPNNAGISVSFIPDASDLANGFVDIVFTTSDNGSCQAAIDTTRINFTKAPLVNAGKDTSICINTASLTLYGQVSQALSQTWTSSGTGTFDDATKLDAIYSPSLSDANLGTVTLTLTAKGNGACSNNTLDRMAIQFVNQPTVFVGPNRSVCEDLDSVSLVGKITNAGGGHWVSTGTGLFKNADSLQTYYYPSLADKTSKNVTLTLSSTLNGLCSASSANFDLKFETKPSISIGSDQTICADSLGVSLSATLSNANGTTWYTSGTGTFSPNANAISVNYLPSLSNRNTRTIKIWSTTNITGSCNAVTDTLNLTLNPSPIVDAGASIRICISKDSLQLSGTVQNATGGKWYTSGTGTFSPSDTTLNAFYHPSANDKSNGNIVLTLRSTGNGLCKSMASQMTLNFKRIPIVDAGTTTTFCNTTQSITLNGTISRATGGQWTTLGGGSILPSDTTLNATYFPTSTEISNGIAKLILNTTGNGDCASQVDTVTFTFQKAPTAIAGPDNTICADLNKVSISSSVTNSTDFVWTSLGSGTFSPGNTTLVTNYAPSSSDIAAQKVGLVISTINDGVCTAAKDTLYISINPLPIISVGNDITLCADAAGVQLTSTLSNAKGVKWTTSGSGSFSPTDSTSNPYYFIHGNDIAQGSVALTATTTGNGTCKAKSDELILTFNPASIINAGPDIAACIGSGAIQLNGTITNTPSATWLTNGSGTFSPNANTLNATYTPSSSDETNGQVTITLVGAATAVCNSNSDFFTISFSTLPVINAGKDSVYCTNSLPIQLLAFGASGKWSGGAGVFSPSISSLKGTYQPTAAEIASGSITLTITTNPGLCPVTSDNVTFTIKQGPHVDAGIDTTICVNTTGFNLYGTTNGVSSGVIWSTASGTGTFSPTATNINAGFTPSSFQIGNGKATLTLTSVGNNGCPASSDKLVIFLTPAPVVNAGFDITSCKDVSTISLTGNKTPSSTNVVWSTSSGLGSFVDATDTNTIFTPNQTDVTAGLVSLYLTATGSTLCKAITDTINVTFTPIPTIFAGNDSTICSNTASKINLNGKITLATGGVWSSTGAGVFSPNANSIVTKYIPTSSELNSGTVTLTFTTTGNGACQAQTDQIIYTIQKPDTVDAGNDMTLCADAIGFSIAGTASTANVLWSSSGSGSFTPVNNLITTYTPSSADHNNGGITLSLTSKNINTCPQATDFATITFNPAPISIVNAGFDQTTCITDTKIQLNGFIANAKGGKWTTNGDGNFTPSDTVLDAEYIIGVTDKTNGFVNITLTSTGNGICNAVTDIMKLSLQQAPSITAIPKNIPACADIDSININATVTVATGGLWKTTGTGIFGFKADSLNTSYYPSAKDVSLGQLWLTVQSINNGACAAALDTAIITFGPGPTIDAGLDMNICRNSTTIPLQATTTIATGGQWFSSGSGTISPNSLIGNYNVALADTNVDIIVMKVTSTGQGTCKPVSDIVIFTFDPVPSVNAGVDLSVCESVSSIQLNGTAHATTDYTWVSNGSGSFLPNNNTLTAQYQPSSSDIQNGSVSISLISSQTNSCLPVADQMTITFVKKSILTITAAPACYSLNGMNITGTVTNANGATWHTNGAGNFTPDNSQLSNNYMFGVSDISKNITFLLISNPGICSSDTAIATVFVNKLPIANAGADKNICPNDKITLTTNTIPNNTYQWKEVGTGTVVGTNSFVTVSPTSTKSYQLQVTDINSCISKDTLIVNVVPPVIFNLAPSACLDIYTPINSKPSKYNPNGTFQWYKDGNILQGKVDTTLLANSAGIYKIVYHIGQCSSDSSIKINPLPTMVNNGRIVCSGSSIIIKTSRLPIGSSYTWKSPLLNMNSNSNIVNPVKFGTSFYYVTGTDNNGCKTTDSIRVIGLVKPVMNLNDTSFCEGDTKLLNAKPINSSLFAGYTIHYNWFKDKLNLNKDTSKYLVSQKGLYKAIVSVEECTNSDSSLITINALPTTILPKESVFCPSKDKQIILDAGTGTPNQVPASGTSYLWNTNAKTQKITVTQKGTYIVIIKNANKCTINDTIDINELCEPQIFIPDAFTPGQTNSGKDLVFLIQGKYFINFKITIYNRWGEVVFSSDSNSKERSWDGTYAGDDMPAGTYPFRITFDAEDPRFDSQKIEGRVTLLR